MDEPQRLKASRKAYRSHLTRLFKKVDEILEKETPITDVQVATLTSSLEQLTQKKDIFQQLHTQLAEAMQTEDDLENEILEAEEIQDTILDKMSVIKHRLESRRVSEVTTRPLDVSAPEFRPTSHPVVSDTEPIVTTREPVNRLPKLTLPIFSGDHLAWQTFHDSFKAAVHNNTALNKIQKFNYLRAQLHGDASRAIAGLPLTDANYDHAMALLTERYGQSHKIVHAHMQALLEITTPTNSLSSLQLFYDTIEAHIRGLAALGKSEDAYGAMLVPIILGKLPVDVRRNLAREHGNSEWTTKELKDAILKEIRVLESGWFTNEGLLESHRTPMTTTLHTNISGHHSQSADEGTSKKVCIFCKGPHPPVRCDIVVNPQKRLDIVKRGKHCFNCLGHHKVSHCQSKFRCKKCKQKHHSSLCGAEFSKSSEAPKTDMKEVPTQPPTTVTAAIIPPEPAIESPTNNVCLLKTAVTQVNAGGLHAEANILLDEGAQRSFISDKLANQLKITPQLTENVKISAFGDKSSSTKQLGVAVVNVETITGQQIPISVLMVPTIAAPLQSISHTHLSNMKHLQGLRLANPLTITNSFEISLLIGADYYWQFVGDHIIRGNGPTAMQSKLGYLLSGPLALPTPSITNTSALHVSALQSDQDINPEFWMMESTGVTRQTAEESDKQFLDNYQRSSIRREDDGAYCVKFPWKEEHPPLPSNYTVCKTKIRSLARRLNQTPELLHMYGRIIAEQEQKGFIEKVPKPDLARSVHYIPHHPIKKESSTTPIRIVYNCSCRQFTNPSLNDCLVTGPSFLTDMCSILLRFRLRTFGLSTDLEKAFLHVRLDEADRDYTRFLWLSTPSNPESDLEVYRFKTVLFGSTSSPFMLTATLHHHLSSYDTQVASDMKQNLYVDNIISGCDTEAQVVEYYKEARSIMDHAKFNLRSWASNSQTLQSLATKEGTADTETMVNLLGLRWNTSTDTLAFSTKQFLPTTEEQPITKRLVLQISSRIYDPLGFLNPITIQAKILMQELWRSGVDWDEPLNQEYKNTWLQIAKYLQESTTIQIPRHYFTPVNSQTMELHVFSDASMKAYGAVAFLRNGKQSCFILARSRVVPLKGHTLPRLELMAAVVASRLGKFILSTFLHVFTDISVKLWTDSQIVIHWLRSQKRLKQFIFNRVQEIKKTFPEVSWRYCPSDDNPADLLTRGLNITQLNSSSLWQYGPPWLTNESQWPIWNYSEVLHLQVDDAVISEEDSATVTQSSTMTSSGIHTIIPASNYSTLSRLIRVSAYIFRFIHNIKHPNNHKVGPLSSEELNESLLLWIYNCQHTSFHKEILNLKSKTGKRLPLVRQLRLFLDKSEHWRCGGRIHNAPVNSDTKFPLLLPKDHLLTRMIVYATHKEQLHAGVTSTVTTLRQRYWIPSARQVVRQLLRRCVTCRKVMGKPYMAPDSPPLPQARIRDGRPFEVTGVDFTGALYVRNRGIENKVYICLFTCGLSRAVHLEVVTDLSVEIFLQAFRRFTSRRSLPCLMLSDNASTYISAAKELEQLFKSHKLQEALSVKGVKWRFIPKRAPWYGGFWERLIGLTKTVLRKVLGRSFITLEALQTLVVEIESVLNDRPLTYLSADVRDPEPLTPSHLLYRRRITTLPHPTIKEDEISDPTFLTSSMFQEKVKRQTQLLQHFQGRWRREYLTSLRETHKYTGVTNQTIKVGDIVLVHDDVPRLQWRLAVVEGLIKGLDGLARAAKIRTSTGRTNRPIVKLFPLELSCETTDSPGSQEIIIADDLINETEPICQKSTRNASIKARECIKNWTDIIRGPGGCPESDDSD